ncbi:MAG: HIT family protein [Gammaproteobacteria bacterium]|nr:HIT family protein [Gammaproteobacteria bacterium]MDH5799950.1 HIT family protein [Gammaproteobacteria bacterium]
MLEFKLHSRLQQDCYLLEESSESLLLLMNNAHYPWFILVPKTDKTELYQLEQKMQTHLWEEINTLSHFLQDSMQMHKLNIAAIGNLVPQLHVHIVGRHPEDPAWPGVVWGHASIKRYDETQVQQFMARVRQYRQKAGKV